MKTKVIPVLFIFLFFACSAVQQKEDTGANEQKKEPEIYVFDDVSSQEDSSKTENPTPDTTSQQIIEEPKASSIEYLYYVQVGAFTTEQRAKDFVDKNQSKIDAKMNITFSRDVDLWVVQLPPFNTREEAEKMRNSLWDSGKFNDAFILTVEKQ